MATQDIIPPFWLWILFGIIAFGLGVLIGRSIIPVPQHLNCVSSWSANVLTIVCS